MHNFKKNLGQNFLQDKIILSNIRDSFSVKENSVIIEVGPGDGALTRELLTKKTNVISFEIDNSLSKYLDSITSDNLKVVYEDFLKVNLEYYTNNYDNIYFISNVPYYITTPIIMKFIESKIIPNIMVLMVQKEVGKRLSAKEHNSEYGAISVLLNYFFNIEYLFDVDRTCFYPIPNVDSAVIKLTKKDDVLELKDYNKYEIIVKDAFKQKRKTLKNNLKKYDLNIVEQILTKYNLDLNSRAEDLNYEVFVDLANNL